MTTHYRWETVLEQLRAVDPGIDDPERRRQARIEREAYELGWHLSEMRKERGLTQQAIAGAMGVTQARVSQMESGRLDRMQVDSLAAYIEALGGHLRLVADFGDSSATVGGFPDSHSA